jgi:hypothetical protein
MTTRFAGTKLCEHRVKHVFPETFDSFTVAVA